jgi:hypothetical protein
MRHHPEYVALFVADASDVFSRAIRVCFIRDFAFCVTISEDHLVVFV